MYLQITDKCNMKCPHCCFACTKKGTFMSLETFKAALEICKEREDSIVIGGGEPTLHPKFEQFLLLAMAANRSSFSKVFIVTNGSIKERAELLLDLTKAGAIEAKLSYDQFHDLSMVDEDIIEGFRALNALWGPVTSYFRDQSEAEPWRNPNGVSKRGRAKKFFKNSEDKCACATTIVKPNGDIHQCGCLDAPKIGDVVNGYHSAMEGECCHSRYYLEAAAEEAA